MNIAAYMAALDIDDLDHHAKHAVQVIAGRASRQTGMAAVSVGRIAADMGVARSTASRALNRAVTAGYLAVDKWPGHRSVWRLKVTHSATPTCSADDDGVTRSATPPVSPGESRRIIGEDQGEGHGEKRGANGAGENRPVNWEPDLPPNPYVYDEDTGTVTYVRTDVR